MPTISALPTHANPLDGTEVIPLVQSGITSKATLSELVTPFDDPIEQINFTEVNGVATTAMRSDAAPALASQLLLPLGFGDFQLETEADPGTGTTGSVTLRTGGNSTKNGCHLTMNGAGATDADAELVFGRNLTLQKSSSAAGDILAIGASLQILTAGKGLDVAEGSNARSGVATLVGGTVVVNTTAVTGSSRIQLTAQNLGTIAIPAALAVSARSGGTSFTILSADPTDTSDVAWFIINPV